MKYESDVGFIHKLFCNQFLFHVIITANEIFNSICNAQFFCWLNPYLKVQYLSFLALKSFKIFRAIGDAKAQADFIKYTWNINNFFHLPPVD